MKKILLLITASFFCFSMNAQKTLKEARVPAAVKKSLHQKYPNASGIIWEIEKRNYEANWGGKSREDNSVLITPSGSIIETIKAIPVDELPKPVLEYVKVHYKGAKITEAGKVTNSNGKISYEAEVKKKDLIFDENGKFKKID